MFLLALSIWIWTLDIQSVGPEAQQLGVTCTVDAFSLDLDPWPWPYFMPQTSFSHRNRSYFEALHLI